MTDLNDWYMLCEFLVYFPQVRALLAPFLQQGNGDADSFPEEDQHEDDKHFKKAEYYHFKQEKKISV